jgi:hypothetical protein
MAASHAGLIATGAKDGDEGVGPAGVVSAGLGASASATLLLDDDTFCAQLDMPVAMEINRARAKTTVKQPVQLSHWKPAF